MIFVTGGAGFIGSNYRTGLARGTRRAGCQSRCADLCGRLNNLRSLENDPRHIFVHGNIGDAALLSALFSRYKPRAVVNFAARPHGPLIPGRKIHPDQHSPAFRLLEAARAYWELSLRRNPTFFLHVSTDGVAGTTRR